jgi:hypothetical protein
LVFRLPSGLFKLLRRKNEHTVGAVATGRRDACEAPVKGRFLAKLYRF